MFIGFDIGGTKTRIAASRDCKTFEYEPKIIETAKDFDDGVKQFVQVVRELCKEEKVEMVAGGIAGPVDKNQGCLLNSPNIPGWIKKPLRDELANALNAPVYIENDTAIVGLGEAHFGAGRGHSIVVYVTVSTGVGGVRIVHGKIDANVHGFEIGHQIIDPTKTLCENCTGSELEDLVSGTATEHRFGVKAFDVADEHVWAEELPDWLAMGLTNSILHWSPHIVVLGGSMIVGKPAINLQKVREKISTYLTIFRELPELKTAELNDLGGVYGALTYLDQHKKK
jgi:predicted NBD/HSP70 family sugar kinase